MRRTRRTSRDMIVRIAHFRVAREDDARREHPPRARHDRVGGAPPRVRVRVRLLPRVLPRRAGVQERARRPPRGARGWRVAGAPVRAPRRRGRRACSSRSIPSRARMMMTLSLSSKSPGARVRREARGGRHRDCRRHRTIWRARTDRVASTRRSCASRDDDESTLYPPCRLDDGVLSTHSIHSITEFPPITAITRHPRNNRALWAGGWRLARWWGLGRGSGRR